MCSRTSQKQLLFRTSSSTIVEGYAGYSVLQKSVVKPPFLERAIDSWMRIKTTTYSDVPAKALPVLLARTSAHHYKRETFPSGTKT